MLDSKLEKIVKDFRDTRRNREKCGSKIKGLLIELLDSKNIKFHEVNYRIKDEESLIKKYNLKNGKYSELNEITDTIGIRIITYYSDDIDRVAELIEENFDVDVENSIDKREILDIDRFGYLSLHYVVKLKNDRLQLAEYRSCKEYKVEIQIRSILQHAWAEIEHDLGYKNDIETPREVRRNFYRLAGLLEIADEKFMDIRNKIREYEENINTRIKDKEETIFIDKISLEAYVNDDRDYNDIVLLISKDIDVIFEEEPLFLSNDLKILSYMKYETINELKNDVIKYKNEIIKISKAILHDLKYETIPKTAILLYLCYVKIAQENDVYKFYSFFDNLKLCFEDDETMESFTDKIIKAYNSK